MEGLQWAVLLFIISFWSFNHYLDTLTSEKILLTCYIQVVRPIEALWAIAYSGRFWYFSIYYYLVSTSCYLAGFLTLYYNGRFHSTGYLLLKLGF